MAKEYSSKVTVNLDKILNMQIAQRETYEKGLVKYNNQALIGALGPVSSVLGILFIQSTPVSVATAIGGLISTVLSPSLKEMLKEMVYNGYYHMGEIVSFLKNNSKYDLCEVDFPFIEYTVDGKIIRWVTGKGRVTKIHVKGGGWITM